MNDFAVDILKIIISYIVVLLIGYLGINFMSNGFLNKFIAVKISRGKKTLVEIQDVGDTYYRTGLIVDGSLSYKNRSKDKKVLNVTQADIDYRMGLKCVSVDGVKNTIIRRNGEEVSGHDAVKTDNLMVRCLTSPKLQDKVLKILLIVTIIILFLTLGSLFIGVKTQKAVQGLYTFMNSTRVI